MNEVIGQALRKAVPVYPELAIRELVANAIIHQDFSITGSGPMVEIFDDRVEITNPGTPLIDPQRLTRTHKAFLRDETFHGNEIVAATRRPCPMNLFLHNIGELEAEPSVERADALITVGCGSVPWPCEGNQGPPNDQRNHPAPDAFLRHVFRVLSFRTGTMRATLEDHRAAASRR